MTVPWARRPLMGLLACVLLAAGAACSGTPVAFDGGPVDGHRVDADRALAVFAQTYGLEGLGRATVRLEPAGRDGAMVATSFAVVVADTPTARERGLQGVDALPDGVGMLFVVSGPGDPRASPGFWMLDTLVPLDIAFASDGTVVGVATMQPCPARPCPITHPGVDYDVALEVAAGALVGAGVRPGDRLTWAPASR